MGKLAYPEPDGVSKEIKEFKESCYARDNSDSNGGGSGVGVWCGRTAVELFEREVVGVAHRFLQAACAKNGWWSKAPVFVRDRMRRNENETMEEWLNPQASA